MHPIHANPCLPRLFPRSWVPVSPTSGRFYKVSLARSQIPPHAFVRASAGKKREWIPCKGRMVHHYSSGQVSRVVGEGAPPQPGFFSCSRRLKTEKKKKKKKSPLPLFPVCLFFLILVFRGCRCRCRCTHARTRPYSKSESESEREKWPRLLRSKQPFLSRERERGAGIETLMEHMHCITLSALPADRLPRWSALGNDITLYGLLSH